MQSQIPAEFARGSFVRPAPRIQFPSGDADGRSGAIPLNKSVFKYARQRWVGLGTVAIRGVTSRCRDRHRYRDQLGEFPEVELIASAVRPA